MKKLKLYKQIIVIIFVLFKKNKCYGIDKVLYILIYVYIPWKTDIADGVAFS